MEICITFSFLHFRHISLYCENLLFCCQVIFVEIHKMHLSKFIILLKIYLTIFLEWYAPPPSLVRVVKLPSFSVETTENQLLFTDFVESNLRKVYNLMFRKNLSTFLSNNFPMYIWLFEKYSEIYKFLTIFIKKQKCSPYWTWLKEY